jgi:hypothetical protein
MESYLNLNFFLRDLKILKNVEKKYERKQKEFLIKGLKNEEKKTDLKLHY